MVRITAYADYISVMSRNLKALKEALLEVDNTAQERGFMSNQEKLKYIYMNVSVKTHSKCRKMAVGGYSIMLYIYI